jgi:hypothetical protein
MKKILFSVLAIIVLAGLGFWFFIFYKPTHFKRNVANEKAIIVTAPDIVKEYQSNEAEANVKYLNKTIAVTGEISDMNTDQDGHLTITLKSNDAMSNVFCTLHSFTEKPKIGSTITVKGICTGFLSDVVLTEAMIEK